MIHVTLYGRKNCHLCEEALAHLHDLGAQFPHRLTVVDIDTDAELVNQYGLEIPVVTVGPFKLKAPFTRQELQVTLAAASDRDRHIVQVENSPRVAEAQSALKWTRSDSFDYWLSNHYMAFFNLLVLIYVGLSFLAPALAKSGYGMPAGLLYKAYGLVCHQLGYRSFYLFGEQAYYPRAAAGIAGVQTFSQATGLKEGSDAVDIFAARAFVGNPQVGYKIALCERDVAIYGGILLFGLLFSLTGRRIPAIPWYVWLLIAIVPIGLDGFSQLFSQPPLNLISFRESTPTLRVLTGFLFGFTTAWFGYPMVEESMVDTRKFKRAKLQRIQK